MGTTDTAGEAGGGPLTDATTLARALASEDPPVVLDVRWSLTGPPGIESYLAGHIPGAVFTDLDADLSGAPGLGGRHPMPEAGEFQAAMRRAGVADGRPVVVYDAADSSSAARAWWVLRYFGHTAVRVLDGGYRAWLAAGGAAETGAVTARAPGDFRADAGHMLLLDAEGAARLAREGMLLDARAAQRYAGEVEPVDRVAGHIPGAVSAPTTDNVGADGRFLPAAALRERFAGLGVPGAAAAGDVGAYCGSGVTAAHEVLALAVVGIPAALYVGSWSEWITGSARPVATGPLPG
ncbi:MAG TPA: sulfurtransferase [Streptosporangiaceae bacterium]|nr:sulfurtransferase [Streptosporangiaceae bacterium]